MAYIPWIIALLLLVIDRGKERTPGARSPCRAAAASLFFPGLGQLYNGQPRKALMFWACGIVLSVIAILTGLLHNILGMAFILIASMTLSFAALIDSIRTAKLRQTYTLKSYNRWYIYLLAILIVAVASIPAKRALNVKAFKIPSEGMLPSLEAGDFIIARLETQDTYKDQRGDILVFRYPGDNITPYIKRVVAFPGEEITIRKGSLFIDGKQSSDTWIHKSDDLTHSNVRDYGPFTVPGGTLFMIGDNFANSSDSRHWGPLPRENIIGVAEHIYFSWDPIKHNIRFNRIGLNVGSDN